MPVQVDRSRPIADTRIFGGEESRRGYRINKFAMSLARAENREAFAADEEGYMARWELSAEEREAVRERDWRRIMDELGGNIYMIIKIGTVTGHGLYQIGAHQRGETYEEFLATRNASGAR